MPTLESVDPGLLFSLFKGEPGTRKSTQALSYPMPQYWFSWDRKMSGILVPARKWGIDTRTLEFDDYDDWDKAKAKLEKFQTNCPYKTLVFDSITTMADASLRQTRKSGGGSKKIGTVTVDSWDEFNAEAAAISEMIALAKDIHRYFKVNIILIAHVIQTEQKSQKGETSISRVLVTAAKKIAAKIPAVCGEIYHFDRMPGSTLTAVATDSYKLFTVHTGDDYARTAINLPREIVFNDDPIYPKYILPAIEKMRKGE